MVELAAGELTVAFLPAQGMLGASLRHRGVELLRRVEDLAQCAERGSTAGIPLLHPWANRLARMHFRVAGREIALDPRSPLLHFDAHGLPIHGVPWSRLVFELGSSGPRRLAARLDWLSSDLLAVFPFPHVLRMEAELDPAVLAIRLTLEAVGPTPVPVSFGFHPYLGIPGVPRAAWHLSLPPMRRLVLDERCLPTGAEATFEGFEGPLGDAVFDDGFELLPGATTLALSGGGRRIRVEMLSGYPFAQVYAPRGKDHVALEPMTAPTDALTTGRRLPIVAPGERYSAEFRIGVEALP